MKKAACQASAAQPLPLICTTDAIHFCELRLKRHARMHSFLVVFHILADKIVTDELAVSLGELLRDRSPHLALRADLDAVYFRNRADAQRR